MLGNWSSVTAFEVWLATLVAASKLLVFQFLTHFWNWPFPIQPDPNILVELSCYPTRILWHFMIFLIKCETSRLDYVLLNTFFKNCTIDFFSSFPDPSRSWQHNVICPGILPESFVTPWNSWIKFQPSVHIKFSQNKKQKMLLSLRETWDLYLQVNWCTCVVPPVFEV